MKFYYLRSLCLFRVANIQSMYDGVYSCMADNEFGPPAYRNWTLIVDNLTPPRNVRIVRNIGGKLYFSQTGFILTCLTGIET